MHLTSIPLLDRLNDLEALILKDKILHVNHTFWSKFAKLQLLGCKALRFQHQDLQLPPDDHPLRHLYIEEDEVYIGPPDLFEHILNRFPEANEETKTKTLYLPPPNHLFRASAYRDQWSQFYVASQQQGVTWKIIQPNVELEDVWALLFPEGAIGLFERVVITAGDHGHLVFALVVSYGICYDVKTESIVSNYIYLFMSLLLYGLFNW
ncbi:hypothetical protein FRC17_007273 [Serendipita sp. 399]|nr:hypothetical protein FRC17_007273 [Serendipita sp. 399]